ncbi:5' end of the coding region for ORF E4 not determined, partial [human papillomavirus 42]
LFLLHPYLAPHPPTQRYPLLDLLSWYNKCAPQTHCTPQRPLTTTTQTVQTEQHTTCPSKPHRHENDTDSVDSRHHSTCSTQTPASPASPAHPWTLDCVGSELTVKTVTSDGTTVEVRLRL